MRAKLHRPQKLHLGKSDSAVTLYETFRLDNLLLSSDGIRIELGNFSINASDALDNLGYTFSLKDGNVTNYLSIKVDFTDFKGGIEWGTTGSEVDGTTVTNYHNVSINGWTAAAAAALYYFGIPAYTLRPAI